MIDISVVIPTCNRRARLLSLLGDLRRSTLQPREVLVVDASDDPLPHGELAAFGDRVRLLRAEKSVCAQRNRGIREARGEWIFLCDDDIQVPPDYLAQLAAHAGAHPAAGALSGLVLEQVGGRWTGQHPTTSALALLWTRVFQLGLWGEIHCHGLVGDLLAAHYRSRGNHISRAGWPVLTDFSAPFFRTPVYALGASLVRRDWLLASPFDERLDRRGYGDNYGVAIGFPPEGIHVVTSAAVRHHKEPADRPPPDVAYAARVLALDLFLGSWRGRVPASRRHLAWSLVGHVLLHAGTRNRAMCRASLRTLSAVVRGRNPYQPRAAT
ncbi:MAG TPA: glycosyltransferase family 2 protein [Polyangia bacterium]|nr:glycosyltransferase family 2 protein [Polyangia bacterium]